METINYQGREIEALQVNWTDGAIITVNPVAETDNVRSGTDVLWRNANGEYYLQRRLRDEHGEYFGIHRISLRGAVLWAIRQHNEESLKFRQDVIQALEAPAARNASRRYADGSMDVSLHLSPGSAWLLRAACELNGRSPACETFDALRLWVVGQLAQPDSRQSELEEIFDENAPEEAETEARITFVRAKDGQPWAACPVKADLWNAIEAGSKARGQSPAEFIAVLLKRRMVGEAPSAELEARREALRAELEAAPAHKRESDWYGERCEEIHALTRQIQARGDARIAAERALSAASAPTLTAPSGESVPLIEVKWLSAERERALFGSQAEAVEIVKAALAQAEAALRQARAVLAEGTWSNPDNQLRKVIAYVRNGCQMTGGIVVDDSFPPSNTKEEA